MSSSLSSWTLLTVAGLLEIVWAVCLKLSDGFTRVGWSIATAIGLLASVLLLAFAARGLPIGTAYAAWVGIGALGTALTGMVALGEPVTPWRVLFLLTLAGSLIGLKATS